MFRDVNGNIYTEAEIMEKRIDEVSININDSNDLAERMDELILDIENTDVCRREYNALRVYMEEINAYLPEGRKNLVVKLDDCFTNILVLFEEFFYKNGYYDNQEC